MSFASRSFWIRVAAVLEDGRRVLLAVVAESSVHSPGTAGAKMFVAEDGERMGTIGGGAMELRVVERAAEMLDSPGEGRWAEQAELHHRRKLDPEVAEQGGEKSGMICAGRQTNLYALLRPEADLGTVESVVELLREGGEGWWAVDSEGRLTCGESPLAPLLQRGEEGKSPLAPLFQRGEEGKSPLAPLFQRGEAERGSSGPPPLKKGELEGDSLLRSSRRLLRDNDSWHFTECLLERRRLAILGGGHCGTALARLMAGAGWHVTVWETRSGVVADTDLSDVAERYRVDDFANAGPAIDYPELTPVVVMTTDVPNDVRALYGVLSDQRGFPFVGAMGSVAKLEEIRRRLKALGVPEERIASLVAPVGLPIDSDTPAEIAVSVAAQLLQRRREWLR